MANNEMNTADAVLEEMESAGEKQKMEEITLKFGKGCVGEPFQGKDGNSYREILIPNKDPEDKRPWQTFVVKANHVHDNQFGKGMWCKLPADGSTTVHRRVKTGTDEQGKPIWDTEKTKMSNKELKELVESYKDKDHDRSSVKEKIEEKKSEVAGKKTEDRSMLQQKSTVKQEVL